MKLHLTLWSKEQTKSFLLDTETQSILPLGFATAGGKSQAIAYAERSGEGVRVRLGDGTVFVGQDERALASKEVFVNGETPLVVGMRSSCWGGDVSLYMRPVAPCVGLYRRLFFDTDTGFEVGRSQSCGMCYPNAFVSARHARIRYVDGTFTVEDLGSGNGTFVNGACIAAHQPRWLVPGDTVQILDLTIMVGGGFLLLNCPDGFRLGDTVVRNTHVAAAKRREGTVATHTPGEPATFYPAPRLEQSIRPFVLQVDAPPQKSRPEHVPVIMQIGPTFFMGLSAVFMGANCVSTLVGGGAVAQTLPTLAMAIAMLGGSLVWPVVSRAYTRGVQKREASRRDRLYVSYLDSVESKMEAECRGQADILRGKRHEVKTLLERAEELSPLLMNRTATHGDFMDLRVGVGDCAMVADVTWPRQQFSVVEDSMLGKVGALERNLPMLRDVPLVFNPMKHRISGIVGERRLVWEFLRGLLVQICALQSYYEVKILLVAEEGEHEEWRFLASLGHLYDDAGERRRVAVSYEGLCEIDALVKREVLARSHERADESTDDRVRYVAVCTNVALASKSEMLAKVSRLKADVGFSLIYIGESLRDLPRECGYIVDLASNGSKAACKVSPASPLRIAGRTRSACMFDRSDVAATLQPFDPDIMLTKERVGAFALHMARARLIAPTRSREMPESLGFLEMYEVGSVEHLNVGQRWRQSDASRSLQVMIGVNERGERAYLNLHEKMHGPHGLIAGTTGSGKSEFVVTYVLSLCVNFAPDEVAFVLIDYKGGGLVGAFSNSLHHLPHLAGAITNLDGPSIHRSLLSIQSELRRRQDMLRRARDSTGEATMDIYKYLALRRQGVLDDPLPHLFIVADEFAELKQQEPDFMEELISAARIGRSLGVHLILATQKPSGVVDDQIWSNARTKVSLKVSDAADSREMIRCDHAANIVRPGQFYMLVGYDEQFWSAQAAYAGFPYVPRDQFEPRRDDAIELLDAEGSPIARMKSSMDAPRQSDSELNAVLEQIERAADVNDTHAQRLWLDPLPPRIALSDLREAYSHVRHGGLCCVVGEVDDPLNQRRFVYELDLEEMGNVMLYGSQGSEVEDLLATMLVSLAMDYAASELWMYCIDFGGGSLSPLDVLPQVGGVVASGDEERLSNLLRLCEDEVERRRLLLASCGGSLKAYGARGNRPLPRMVLAIANLAALEELHPDVVDRLVSITRDAPRFGMYVAATVATTSAARMRLRANFGVHVPTMLNETSDYLAVLGSLMGVIPPRQERRGLVRIDKGLYEFQGASIAHAPEDEGKVIAAVADAATQGGDAAAPPIPQLPKRVTAAHMREGAGASKFPVGYARADMRPTYYDLAEGSRLLVLGNDADLLESYLRGVYETFCGVDGMSFRFVDPHGVLGRSACANVLRTTEEVESFVGAFVAGDTCADVVVFTGIVQTMSMLGEESSRLLQGYLADGCGTSSTRVVAASELWRTTSLYASWYKALSAQGNGVWVGTGFYDQSVLRFTQVSSEQRKRIVASDGFVAIRGNATAVRLVAEARPSEISPP